MTWAESGLVPSQLLTHLGWNPQLNLPSSTHTGRPCGPRTYQAGSHLRAFALAVPLFPEHPGLASLVADVSPSLSSYAVESPLPGGHPPSSPSRPSRPSWPWCSSWPCSQWGGRGQSLRQWGGEPGAERRRWLDLPGHLLPQPLQARDVLWGQVTRTQWGEDMASALKEPYFHGSRKSAEEGSLGRKHHPWPGESKAVFLEEAVWKAGQKG